MLFCARLTCSALCGIRHLYVYTVYDHLFIDAAVLVIAWLQIFGNGTLYQLAKIFKTSKHAAMFAKTRDSIAYNRKDNVEFLTVTQNSVKAGMVAAVSDVNDPFVKGILRRG